MLAQRIISFPACSDLLTKSCGLWPIQGRYWNALRCLLADAPPPKKKIVCWVTYMYSAYSTRKHLNAAPLGCDSLTCKPGTWLVHKNFLMMCPHTDQDLLEHHNVVWHSKACTWSKKCTCMSLGTETWDDISTRFAADQTICNRSQQWHGIWPWRVRSLKCMHTAATLNGLIIPRMKLWNVKQVWWAMNNIKEIRFKWNKNCHAWWNPELRPPKDAPRTAEMMSRKASCSLPTFVFPSNPTHIHHPVKSTLTSVGSGYQWTQMRDEWWKTWGNRMSEPEHNIFSDRVKTWDIILWPQYG